MFGGWGIQMYRGHASIVPIPMRLYEFNAQGRSLSEALAASEAEWQSDCREVAASSHRQHIARHRLSRRLRAKRFNAGA